MKRFVCLVVLWLFPAWADAQSLNVPSLFQEGIALYQQGNFEEATQKFEMIVSEGAAGGDLYYNLGNSYYRQGQVGRAIAAYRKAEELLPRDNDLRHNLQYARKHTKDKIELRQSVALKNSLLFWYDALTFQEWFVFFLFANALFWGLALLRIYRQRDWVNGFFIASLCLALFSLATVLSHSLFKSQVAVVVEPEVSVYSGPGTVNTELFRLHEGAELQLLDEDSGWLRLRLADGKEGWLERRFVTM